MALTRIQKVKRMIEELKAKQEIISDEDLKSAMYEHLGSEERTYNGYVDLIRRFKLIEELPNGTNRFL